MARRAAAEALHPEAVEQARSGTFEVLVKALPEFPPRSEENWITCRRTKLTTPTQIIP